MPWIGQTQALGRKGGPPPRKRRMAQASRPPIQTLPPSDGDPSWGPVGSLLKREHPELYARLTGEDADRRAAANLEPPY
jgi:hypothetical protein